MEECYLVEDVLDIIFDECLDCYNTKWWVQTMMLLCKSYAKRRLRYCRSNSDDPLLVVKGEVKSTMWSKSTVLDKPRLSMYIVSQELSKKTVSYSRGDYSPISYHPDMFKTLLDLYPGFYYDVMLRLKYAYESLSANNRPADLYTIIKNCMKDDGVYDKERFVKVASLIAWYRNRSSMIIPWRINALRDRLKQDSA